MAVTRYHLCQSPPACWRDVGQKDGEGRGGGSFTTFLLRKLSLNNTACRYLFVCIGITLDNKYNNTNIYQELSRRSTFN